MRVGRDLETVPTYSRHSVLLRPNTSTRRRWNRHVVFLRTNRLNGRLGGSRHRVWYRRRAALSPAIQELPRDRHRPNRRRFRAAQVRNEAARKVRISGVHAGGRRAPRAHRDCARWGASSPTRRCGVEPPHHRRRLAEATACRGARHRVLAARAAEQSSRASRSRQVLQAQMPGQDPSSGSQS